MRLSFAYSSTRAMRSMLSMVRSMDAHEARRIERGFDRRHRLILQIVTCRRRLEAHVVVLRLDVVDAIDRQ